MGHKQKNRESSKGGNSLYYKASNKIRRPNFIVRFFKSVFTVFSDLRLRNKTKRELNAVIMIFLSGIIILSLINTAGIVGQWLKEVVTKTFGAGSFILPLIFVLSAIKLFLIQDKKIDPENPENTDRKKDYSIFRLYIGSFLLICSILGLFHINVPWDNIKSVALNGEYGGYVGFTVNFFLRPLFSTTGSIFILIFMAIFSIQLAFEISWKDIIVYLFNYFRQKKPEKIRIQIDKITRKEVPVFTKEPQQEKKEEKESDEPFSIQNIRPKDMEFKLPDLDLLDFEPFAVHIDLEEIIENKKIIKKTFEDFNISIYLGNESATGELLFQNKEHILKGVAVGPTVTQYAFKPEAGVKLAKLTALQNDLALALAARSLRIEAPIPGQALVGIEIPNDTRSTVKLRPFFESKDFSQIKSNLRLCLGRDVSGNMIIADLAKMPHLLVAGATGSGKSVAVNTFIVSLLYQNSPETLKFIMVDPKRVELSLYNGIPHLLSPVIVDPQKTVQALRWAVAEMDRRYRLLSERGHKNILDFNSSEPKEDHLPYIVILIDELADLMMVASREVEGLICRIAQMARAVGIHLILATQRPSVDVITGLIKANIPTRIAFTVSSGVDSKTIIDTVGAERLLGSGDMLYLAADENKPRRLQGIFLNSHEIRKVTNFVKSTGEPDYDQIITEDRNKIKGANFDDEEDNNENEDENERANTLFDEPINQKVPGVDDFNSKSDDELLVRALQTIIDNKKGSASFLQRRMRLGYSRASRIIDLLEDRGFLGPQDGAKPREILISKEAFNELLKNGEI